MNLLFAARALSLTLPLAFPLVSSAGTVVFDFDDGVDSQWVVLNATGLWDIGTTGPDLAISKPDDPGIEAPQGFISGGIRSAFELEGDFDVTVDFTLLALASDPQAPLGLSESMLSVSDSSGGQFAVLRFASMSLGQWIEAYSSSVGPLGAGPAPPEILSAGRYRIVRTGPVLSGYWAAPGSADFQLLGSSAVSALPMRIALLGVQGANGVGADRSTNEVDLRFDDLVVQGVVTTAVEGAIQGASWGRIKTAYRKE